MSELDVSAQLAVQLGAVADGLKREQEWRRRCSGALQRVTFATPQVTGNGTVDLKDTMGAKTGYIWDVKRLTVNGFTAGSVTAYKNSALGEPVAPYPAPAVFTYGKGQLLLGPDERLIFSGAGITGTWQAWGEAVCFEAWYLPWYLG